MKLNRWHVSAAGLALAVALLALALSVFTGSGGRLQTVFGQKLNARGAAIYQRVHAELGEKNSQETLPPAAIARLNDANDQAATKSTLPVPLATPKPITLTRLVGNYSSRNGHQPLLWVVHDTESPNVAGVQDVLAIVAWFNNPRSQASSNYTTDAEGDTILMVPVTAKAWTQAYFNSWAISDELIGYATQTVWPDVQLRAAAQLAAHDTARYGIPVQRAIVNGCTILRPGILEHRDLGACGGGHRDAGPAFPLDHFIALVNQYRAGGYHPIPASRAAALKTRHGYYAWLAWRLADKPWKPYGPANPAVRPNVPARVPTAWWTRQAAHLKAGHA